MDRRQPRPTDYSLKRWNAQARSLDDPMQPIDNNWVENRIRPLALRRSDWLLAVCVRPIHLERTVVGQDDVQFDGPPTLANRKSSRASNCCRRY